MRRSIAEESYLPSQDNPATRLSFPGVLEHAEQKSSFLFSMIDETAEEKTRRFLAFWSQICAMRSRLPSRGVRSVII